MRTTKHDWKEAGTIYLSLFFYLAVDASEKQSSLARLWTKLTNNQFAWNAKQGHYKSRINTIRYSKGAKVTLDYQMGR